MDSLSLEEVADQAFNLGFSYGSQWFILYLVIVLGVFIIKIIKGL